MKKDNRQRYLDTWREYLKGKNQIDPKALADYLKDKLRGDFSETTLKRYTATIIANLYENGFLAGKKGKSFAGEPLELIREITPYVLDQALTQNYKKVKFTDLEKPVEMVETKPEASKAKKIRKAAGKTKAEKPAKAATAEVKQPGRKPGRAKKEVEATPGKAVAAVKAKKTPGRKPGPKKKVAEKPKKAVAVKAKKAPGRKPGRKPGKKAQAMVPAVRGKKRGGEQAEVMRKGQEALEFFLDQQRQIDEMALALANYERVFEAVRGLFSREMEEIEELVAGLLAK